MDEDAFRSARSAAVPRPCVFEKALQAGGADCGLALRRALAEREAIDCASPVARTRCATLYALLRERSAFALMLPPDVPAPHAAMLRLQCGGLAGLHRAVAGGPADVQGLVMAALERHRSLDDLPWPDIVAAVRAWQGRRRGERPSP